ncbi:MAG: mechanosensitive ion channel [bacterium]
MKSKMKSKIRHAFDFAKEKKNRKHTILVIALVLTFIFSGYIYGVDSIFIKPLPFTNSVLQAIWNKLPTALTTYFIMSSLSYINKAVYYLLHKVFNHTARSETILKMLFSFIKYGVAIVAILYILTLWGVDADTLLTSAGGLALVVGLGAQALISDVLAGVFIVFEGEFNVGDIVVIDGWRGKVLSIGIRSTKFRDIYGDIKTINNSQITTVVNKTKELSMADVVVGINYG